MTNEEQQDQDMERLKQAVSTLREFFDAVQIFATQLREDGEPGPGGQEGGGTLKFCAGGGNWYARYGQVRDWVNCEEACARQQALEDDKE